MRLSISNIAWDVTEDYEIVNLLHRYHIDAIDISPGKYFFDPLHTRHEDITRVRDWWAEQGIEIIGMQALLFGTRGFNLFGPLSVQNAILSHLESVCLIGRSVGATRLAFGSPKNRDCSGLTTHQAMRIAVSFFKKLGDIAKSYGVIMCLEPNPPCYGANFMTNHAETMRVVKEVNHPNIKMQLDIGALTINKEDVSSELAVCADLIGHIHASEPALVPIGDGIADHRQAYIAIERYLPNHLVSIEMLATKNESHLVSIERALNTAIQNYRPNIGVNP